MLFKSHFVFGGEKHISFLKSVANRFAVLKALQTELNECVKGAENAEKPWDAKDGLTAYYASQLTQALADAATVMNYGFNPDFIKATKEAYDKDVQESNDIKSDIDNFDVKDVDGYAAKEGALKARIDALKKNLSKYNDQLKTDNGIYVENKTANEKFETEYGKAEEAYNKAIDQISQILSTDAYAEKRRNALSELNTAYQGKVMEAYKENALKDGKNTTADVEKLVNDYLVPAKTEFETIVKKYTKIFEGLEAYHTKGIADINTLNERLKTTTDDLEKYKGETYGLDQQTDKVDEIKAKIEALKNIVDNYINNNGQDYTEEKTAIEGKLTDLEAATSDGIANAKAYETALNAIDQLESSLKTAIEDAQEVSYVDGEFTYQPVNYITTTAISDLIDKDDETAPGLRQSWAKLYKEGNAKGKTVDGTAVTDAIDKYTRDINAAKTAYENAAKKRNERAGLVESLKDLDADVTLDGSATSTDTYGSLKNTIQAEVDAIQTKLNEAKDLKDAKHTAKINEYTDVKIGKTPKEVEALVKAYSDVVNEEGKVTAKGNKTKYYENLNIAAAEKIIAQAKASVDASSKAIGELTVSGTGLDSDKQQKELQTKRDGIKSNIDKINSETIAETETEFLKNKAEYATTAIASLSPVIKELNGYAKQIEDLKVKIAAQEANFKAYQELMKLNSSSTAYTLKEDIAGSITTAKSNVKGETDESKLDASQTYYVDLLDGYQTELTNLETEINNYYYAGTMASEDNKTTANNKVTGLKSKVEVVTANYRLNNTNHKSQLDLASALQTWWNQKYTEISETDQTSKKDAVLKDLDAQLQEIINFKKDINDAWSKGESKDKNKDFEDKEDLIRKDINTIYTNWDGTNGWRQVLVDDNNKKHEVFMAAYKLAKAQFDAAIVSLEAFSKIKNADTKAVMNSEDLIKTHKEIYNYADKFRTLLEKEQGALSKANGTEENTDPTDPTVFDEAQFINNDDKTGAGDYADQILAQLNKYRSVVNSKAYDKHIECIKDAVEKVVLAEYAIKGYDKTVTDAKYLESAQKLIATAQLAASLKAETTDGVIVNFTYNKAGIDPEFAVKIDDYVNTAADPKVGRFASELDGLVFEGKNNAADAQFAVLANAIDILYNTEVTAINGFAVADKNSYLTELGNLYADTYTEATAEWEELDASTDKVQYLANWSTNPLNNYKASGKENSQTWIDANTEHTDNTADATAKTAVETMLSSANLSYTITAGKINELYGPHCPGNRISTQLDNIANKLDEFKARNAEAGGHVSLQGEVDTYTKSLTTELATLQIDAIDFEFSQLGIEIDKVKEHYNKLVKATEADKLNDIEVYEVTIDNYYAQRTEKMNAWGKLTNEEKLGAFEKYKSGLIDFAAQIFATGNELIARYEKDKGTIEAEAVSAVQAEQTKVTEDLKKIAGMLDAYENDLKMYQEEYKSLTIKLNSINILFESYTGSISFYKDNLISDYQKLAEKVSALNDKVELEYTKCVTDTKIYNSLIEKFNALNTQLETANEEVKGYEVAAADYANAYVSISEAIESNIEALKNRIKKLTSEDETIYNSICDNQSDDIKTYEYHVKVAQTAIYQTEFVNAYNNAEAATKDDANKDKLYGATTKIEIYNELKRLLKAITGVSTYVTNAKCYGDGTGVVTTDILTGASLADDEKNWSINFVSDAEGFDYIESTLLQLKEDAKALKTKAEEMAYIQGDADNDGVVTVNDYSEVRGWILSATKYEDVPEAKRLGGDVNDDKEFTVADMAGISNLIFHGEVKVTAAKVSARMRAAADAADQLTLTSESEETTIFGKTVRMALNVENAETFTAGQLDITLPQGMKIAAQSLSDRANGHELLTNNLGNGIVRMVASTVENNAFTGHNGALIYIDVEVGSDYNGGQIAIDNVIFSDANANSYYLSKNAPILPTGVEGIQAATMKERIYSVGGQMLKAVKKGVNIIKGENGTKKVISNK